jgi:hypothetical protein
MPRVITYETYAPVIFGDDDFLPSVTSLVRSHLDKRAPAKAVVTRTTDQLVPQVQNRATVFTDSRYYFGRLVAPNVTHNTRKIDSIRDNLNQGIHSIHAGGLLRLVIDDVTSTVIETTRGPETLITARQEKAHDLDAGGTLAEYTEEVVTDTNALIRRRKSLTGIEFNTLHGLVPIVSLGSLASTQIDVEKLVENIGELVEGKLDSLVYVPEEGLSTKLTSN